MTPSPAPCTSTSKADVIFILDFPESIGIKNWRKQLQFVADMTKQFTIGPAALRFGVVINNFSPLKLFDLNSYTLSSEQALVSTMLMSSLKYTDKALNFVQTQKMFSPISGGRDSAPDIVVLITEGTSNSVGNTISAAKNLKSSGVSIITVGVGGNLAVDVLQTLASSRADVVVASSFDTLGSVQRKLVDLICSKASN
ncbi:collagen alpha-1(XX) chain-like [Physella acuta]|uniref:collagen alpha-1(XX) chain-like n=1 Tax=Physella acuta TaxID=109671 RepID=UPI0027DBAB32|nr:collagen alpha-1(XX) chain-like [Physella acuta]